MTGSPEIADSLVALVTLALAVFAYLLGSIPTGVLIAKRRGIDLRAIGSGNVGATNVGRALGKRWAVIVMLLDSGKGALPTVLALALGPSYRGWPAAIAAFCAVLGHVFSLFLRGKGGKGVATALGGALALSPPSALAAFAVYVAVYLPLRISSVGSMAGALAYCLFLYFFGSGELPYLAYAAAATLVIVARHRENIRRLIDGNELRS